MSFRDRRPRTSTLVLTGLFLGPVVTPAIVLAVALYSMARATGLVGTSTALVVALALVYGALRLADWRPLTIVTGSMRPAYSPGDLIIVPNGTPHWFKEVKGEIQYLGIKVTKQ